MSKTSNQFGSAKMGFFMYLVVAIVLAAIAFGLILGTIHVSNQMVKAILTLVCVAGLVYLTFNIAGFWRSWRSGNGTTTASATTAASTTTPVAPAVATTTTSAAPTIAPATPAPTSAAPTIAPATPAPTAKKITRAYLQQQAALVDDRMVEAEEVYEAAEKLQDEYKAAKSDYEQKLAKANARRLPPQQP